ncbi:MAG: hypothetical protein LBI18_09715 [Planctomycetaceae bacterium]|nr:hypothetical protein [Planctomycetaceae bacterium]
MVGGLEKFKDAIIMDVNKNLPIVSVKEGNTLLYAEEELTRLMSGVKYGLKGNDFGKIYQLNGENNLRAFSAVNATIDDYKTLFEYNYNLFNGPTKMKILFYSGNLEVYIGKPSEKLSGKNLYYRDTGINIGDGKIYLQNHWGSGVQFSNIIVKPYYE